MTALLGTRTRRLVAVLVVLLLIAGGYGVRLLTRPASTSFSAVFSRTVGLYKGSDVRVLGLPVGTVTRITPRGKDVLVTMRLDPGTKVAPGTGAVIVSPTLVSDRYVQLTEPWTGGRAMTAGTTIPESRTATPVEVDALYQSLDNLARTLGPDGANDDGSLSRLIKVGAKNLDGNGRKLNTVLREFGKATGALSESDQDFFGTLSNFKDFNDTLVANDRGVAQVNKQFADVTSYLADDRQDLSRALKNLAAALAVLDDFIKANRDNLKTSVDKLIGPTQTLVRERKALEQAIETLPVGLQNFLNAYNPEQNTLDGRINLNELGVGANGSGSARSAASGRQADPSTEPPPALLPGLDQTSGSAQ